VKQATWHEWLVGALGLVLIGLLWAPWYGDYFAGWMTYAPGPGHGLERYLSVNGWNAGHVTSVVIVVVGGLCVAQLVALLIARSPGIGLAWNVAITWLTAFLVVWVAVRLVWPPDDAFRGRGVWLTFIVALALLVVSWRGMADERTTRHIEPPLPITPIPPPS
jgi:hypothetical protein